MCLTKQIKAASRRSGPRGKNVVVLRRENINMKGGTVIVPNTIEMAKIRKSHTGQFKTDVQISSAMTAADVEGKLKEVFVILRHTTRSHRTCGKKRGIGPAILISPMLSCSSCCVIE